MSEGALPRRDELFPAAERKTGCGEIGVPSSSMRVLEEDAELAHVSSEDNLGAGAA